MWIVQLVPTQPVVKAHPTNINSSELTTEIKRDAKIIDICVPQWNTWFKLYANGTIGVLRPNTRKHQLHRIMGTPIHQCVITGNIHQTLSLLQCIEQRNRVQIVSDTVYFKHKYITNTTVTPEDAAARAYQQLTVAQKGNFTASMDENEIDRLNKLDVVFNTTAKKFRQWEENQNPKTRQKNQHHLRGCRRNLHNLQGCA